MSLAGEEEERANVQSRKLITLHTRVSLLSDIYASAGYSHGRATQTLLQLSLGETPNPLQELNALHRACVWENVIPKSALSVRGIDTAPQHDLLSFFGSATAAAQDSSAATPSAAASTTTNGASTSTSTSAANGATTPTPTSTTATNGAAPAKPSTTTSTPPANASAKKEEQPRDKNAKGFKHLTGQIPSALGSFF